MAAWSIFLRDHGAKPFTISTKPGNESILERKGQLEGEVFIVTQGGQNYKLGLVQIALYPMDTCRTSLDRKKSEANAALQVLKPKIAAAKAENDQANQAESTAFNAALNSSIQNRNALEAARDEARERQNATLDAYFELLGQQNSYTSDRFYFDALPEPLVTTQTNSDGRFTLEVPTKGQFVIAATGSRSVGDSTEHYYWLLKISLDGVAKKTIMLSNNNLTSERFPDSLLLTSD